MADITDKDIEETLAAAGLKTPPAAKTTIDPDIAQTLKEAGITSPDSVVRAPSEPGVTRITVRPEPPNRPMGRFNEAVVSGMPIFGPLLDKAVAATGAAIQPVLGIKDVPATFGERYEKNLADLNTEQKGYAERNPITSTAGNLIGATMATMPLMGAPAALSAVLQPAVGSQTGAKVMGALLGGYGPTLGSKMITGGLGNAGIASTDAALRSQDVGDAAKIGFGLGAAAPVAGAAVERGIGGIANYLWPRKGVFKDVNPVNVNRLSQAVEGETPASLQSGLDRAGPTAVLGDINPRMTDLMGGLADTPGPQKAIIRQSIVDRAAGQRDRITGLLDENLGRRFDPVQVRNMITEERAQAADPLYQQFRETRIHPTDEVKALIPRLQKAGAFKRAQELSNITGEPINMKFFTGGPQKEFPTAQTWDYVKQGLDRRISEAYDKGDKTIARALVKLRKDVVSAVEKAPGGGVWKKARSTFADYSNILDQLNAGRDTFLGGRNAITAAELREELESMGHPELMARIAGAREAMDEAMGATLRGDSTLRNQLLSPNNRAKIKLLLGDSKGDKVIRGLEQESFIADQTGNVIGNMNTGASAPMRSERVKNLQAPVGEPWGLDFSKPVTYLPPSLRRQLTPMGLINAWRGQQYAAANQELANLLLTQRGDRMNDLVKAMMDEGNRRAMISSRAGAVGNRLTNVLSAPAITTYRRANP